MKTFGKILRKMSRDSAYLLGMFLRSTIICSQGIAEKSGQLP